MASAIHIKLQAACKMPAITKTQKERTPKQIEILCKIEHRRWNAYTRAEGYSYAPQRYDLAKLHQDLVPFDRLSDSKKKNDIVYLPEKLPATKEQALLGQPLWMRVFLRICYFLCEQEWFVCCCYWLCTQKYFVAVWKCPCVCDTYKYLVGWRFYRRSSKVHSLRYFNRWLHENVWMIDLKGYCNGEKGYNKLEDKFLKEKKASKETDKAFL